jgi:hypothetical protein
MRKPKQIELNQETLKWLWQVKSQSPQRWSSLPPDLAAKAKAVWERVRPWWAPTYEPFEFQLTKDEHPEVEITAWERIGDAIDIYMASHPTADRSWVQDILGMISVGVGPTKRMPFKRRKMFKELRRLYLRCGGKVTPLAIRPALPNEQHESGNTTPDPRYLPAMPIEQVTPVDVMTADWIVARDQKTRQCYSLYPESLPADVLKEPDREIPMLLIEFDQDNEHHRGLVDNIIRTAKGEA